MPSHSRLPWNSIPNLLTLGALFWAWMGIVALLHGHFFRSFALILIAFVFDTLDGWTARRMNLGSDYGKFLDAHIDVFIYLLYPALALVLAVRMDSPIELGIIFIFLAAGLFRLIRFTLVGFVGADSHSYPGVPVVFSHVVLLVAVALKALHAPSAALLTSALLTILSILMVQTFPFPKPGRIQWLVSLLILLAIGFGVADNQGWEQQWLWK